MSGFIKSKSNRSKTGEYNQISTRIVPLLCRLAVERREAALPTATVNALVTDCTVRTRFIFLARCFKGRHRPI